MTLKASKQQRIIRVFISSTFRDMQAERDELVKYTFPKLRSLCESRGVVWGEVDLRWGITDEEKAEGKVLPLCLEEIKNCRPYFIGFLGERYGWVPDKIPEDIIEREPWLKEHFNHSVTELEILHGVLNNPEMANHAFFYFRDPAYINTLIDDKRKDFIEDNPGQRQKLHVLKDRIRKSRLSVRENYPTPKAIGELVLKDMTDVINKLFPEGPSLDPLDRDASEHEQFAKSRVGVYIGREEYFKILDEHVNSDNQPLVVLGESGSGKSALLSTWALQYKEKHPKELVIMHFIGATPYSADWIAMLRRVMGEFKRHFNLSQEIPSKPDELKTTFTNWLHMVSARGKVVLILDALNQLEDKDAAPDLVWIPPFIPENIRMIVSTLQGRSFDEINRRGWNSLKIEPLNKDEKRELIIEYLKQYSKKLTLDHVEMIANAPQTTNPLYLRALLEELRLYGDHFTINKRIKHYLCVETIDNLYGKILQRYEEDYERDRLGLVREAMSLLWASRRGISETELMELLGTDGLPLPKAYWSPLYLAAKDALVSRSGQINFSHDYFRKAVLNRYLTMEKDKKHAHLRLADYFERQELTFRKIDELPWQLSEANELKRLKDCVSSLDMFKELNINSKKYELIGYWLKIKEKHDMVKTYKDAICHFEHSNPKLKDLIFLLNQVAIFFYLNAYYSEAVLLYKRVLDIVEKTYGNDHIEVATAMNNLSKTIVLLGDYKEAESLYFRAWEIMDKIYGPDNLESTEIMCGLAELFTVLTEYDSAEPIYKKILEIREKKLGHDHIDLARPLRGLAHNNFIQYFSNPILNKHLSNKAEHFLLRALPIMENNLGPDHPDVGGCLEDLAKNTLFSNITNSFYFKKALTIKVKKLGFNHPEIAESFNSLGSLYFKDWKLAEAIYCFRRAILIVQSDVAKKTNISKNRLIAYYSRRMLLFAYMNLLIVTLIGFLCIAAGIGLNAWIKPLQKSFYVKNYIIFFEGLLFIVGFFLLRWIVKQIFKFIECIRHGFLE